MPTVTHGQKPPRPGSKQARLITMLMQPGGRSVDELSESLGWQAHTTRAVISRLQKSGHVVIRTKNDAGVSVYRIKPAGGCLMACCPACGAGLGWLVGHGVIAGACPSVMWLLGYKLPRDARAWVEFFGMGLLNNVVKPLEGWAADLGLIC